MLAVMSSPPERTALTGGASQDGHCELHDTPCSVRPVREAAVVDGRDEEHPHNVQRHSDPNGYRADAGQNDSKAGQMNGDEGYRSVPVDIARFR